MKTPSNFCILLSVMNMSENRIQYLRDEADMKQADLAKRIDVAPNTLSNYENENRKIPLDKLRLICEVFGVTADYVLGWSDIREYKFTVQEYALIAAYRKAVPDDRDAVDSVMKKYMKKEKPAERA